MYSGPFAQLSLPPTYSPRVVQLVSAAVSDTLVNTTLWSRQRRYSCSHFANEAVKIRRLK